MIRTPPVAEMRRQINGLIDLNLQQLRRAKETGSPKPSLRSVLSSRKTVYAPSPEPECLRSVDTILADSFPVDVEELTAWRIAELRERGETDARFEIIGIYHDNFPIAPCTLLVIRADGRFENPMQPEES